MFKKSSIKEFPLKIFIVVSVFIFVVFVFLIFGILAGLNNNDVVSNQETGTNNSELVGNDFLNKDYEHKDPYTTKIPNLKDMLKGPIISNADPSLGNVNSPVNIVIYSDFECEYCAKQEKLVKEMMDKFDLRLTWKDYPSNDRASRSYLAAVAARCSQKENAFWGFHDLLYSDEYELNQEGFVKIASKLNLDMDDFNECFSKAETASLINDNMTEAEALGIAGVPFMYVNQQEVLGEIEKKDLEKLIELELGKK